MSFMGIHVLSFVAGLIIGWLWGSGFFRGLMGRRAGG